MTRLHMIRLHMTRLNGLIAAGPDLLRDLVYIGPRLDHLHELAKTGSVDPGARVRGVAEVVVAAPASRVWSVLTDLPGWTSLGIDVKEISAPDGVAVDAAFTWNNSGMAITSRFAVVEPGRELTWTGTTYGVKAVHRVTLSPHGAGTLLRTEETMAAPGLPLLYPSHKLTRDLHVFVSAFARAAEGITPGSRP